jgi:RimJ/RimL family protein N-acetyltransferase
MGRLPMPRPVPIFRGQLVTLRPPDPAADAGDYYEFNLDPDMHTWTGNRVLESEAEARTELDRYVAMEDISTWMIVDNLSGQVIGRFFLYLEEREGVLVVGEGNRIAKPFWRKGHNREARMLLFPYIFEQLRADLVETGAWADNVNSIRSIESYGFELNREETQWNEKHGKRMRMRYYVLTRHQYQASALTAQVGMEERAR